MNFKGNYKIKQQGITLIEMMISLVIGVFILGGVSFTYISMKTTTKSTLEIGELQESGRLAMDILSKDIERAGFWGTYYGNTLDFDNVSIPTSISNDCSDGANNASFPIDSADNFRFIYGVETKTKNAMACISTAVPETDIIQLKGLAGVNIDGEKTNIARYYLVTQKTSAQLRAGDNKVFVLDNLNSSVWQYNHHVYYISSQTGQIVNGYSTDIPTLMRRRLVATKGGEFVDEVIMEGVENMRFIYGLDTDGTDTVDTYRTVEQMGAGDWQQSNSKIMSVQIFLLVRSLREDFSTPAIRRTYILGGVNNATAKTINTNDQFKRSVFVSTVRLANGGSELW